MNDGISIWLEHDGKRIQGDFSILDLDEGPTMSCLQGRWKSSDGRSVISFTMSTSTRREAFRETLLGHFSSAMSFQQQAYSSVRERLTRCGLVDPGSRPDTPVT